MYWLVNKWPPPRTPRHLHLLLLGVQPHLSCRLQRPLHLLLEPGRQAAAEAAGLGSCTIWASPPARLPPTGPLGEWFFHGIPTS